MILVLTSDERQRRKLKGRELFLADLLLDLLLSASLPMTKGLANRELLELRR